MENMHEWQWKDMRTTAEAEATRCQRSATAYTCPCGKPAKNFCPIGSVMARNMRVPRLKRLIEREGGKPAQ